MLLLHLRRIPLLQLLLLLQFSSSATFATSASSLNSNSTMQTTLDNQTIDNAHTEGDPQCPCIMTPIPAEEQSKQSTYYGVNSSIETYGVGCAYHDINKFNCTASCDKSKPYVQCLDSWCRMAW